MHEDHWGLPTNSSPPRQFVALGPSAPPVDDRGELLTAISAGLVELVEAFFGYGTAQANSYYQDDRVVCVLRGGFCRVEQPLLDAGYGPAVIEQRKAFRELMLDRVVTVVEDTTPQRVIGFLSADQQSSETICAVFILAPRPSASPRRPTSLSREATAAADGDGRAH